LNIKDNELVFTYTGRLSMQKNVIELASMMNELRKTFQYNFKLLIAGPFDDLGIPYIGQYSQEGAYCTRWLKQIPKYDFVHYLGNLNATELNQLYSASDCFISLSTHNDEDFGMSPCEAGATGLPLILTNWGGYSSFKKYFKNTHLVDTSFNKSSPTRPLPDKKSLFKVLINFLENESSSKRITSNHCSLMIMRENISTTIINLENATFTGFTDLMIKVAARFSATKNSPFSGVRGNYSDLYYDLYDSYVEKENHDV
jgi:glycosyltransferase involved in cell wall biosynthesis